MTSTFIFIIFSAFITTQIFAQGPGRGISKSTWAASDRSVLKAYTWFMKYLPVEDADDSCTNNICTCGKTGRVALKTSLSGSSGNLTVSPGFGIHTVLSEGENNSRENANGGISVEDFEDIWDEELKTMWGSNGKYSAWADNHLSLYTSDSLSKYTEQFDSDSVNYVVAPYTDPTSSSKYYSLIVQVPQTQVVLEIISSQKGDTVTNYQPEFFATGEVRHDFINLPATLDEGLMSPLAIARSTSNISEIIYFYKEVFQVDPLKSYLLEDGTQIVSFQLNDQATVQIRYTQRTSSNSGSDEHTVAWLEKFFNQVNTKYMTTYKSCWPVYGDNHYCFDSRSMDMDRIKDVYDQHGWKYHLFGMPGRGRGNGYFATPTGWQIQLDGSWTSFPSDAESFSPNYCMESCLNAN